MNNQLINTKMLKCFVNQVVIQSPNMTQVTIAIKVNQWKNDISSRKIKKTTEKKDVARKSRNGY